MTDYAPLPWELDALQPDPPPWTTAQDRDYTPDVPPVPVTSSTAAPAGLPSIDWGNEFQRSIQEATESALFAAAPAIQEQLTALTQHYITGLVTGKPVSPYITTTVNGKELTVASAKNRSWRTFLGGMGVDIMFALVAVMGTLGHVDFFSQAGWLTLGVLMAKTVIQTAISYVARMKVAPPYEPK